LDVVDGGAEREFQGRDFDWYGGCAVDDEGAVRSWDDEFGVGCLIDGGEAGGWCREMEVNGLVCGRDLRSCGYGGDPTDE
jgi:hypothetical protein